MSMPDVHKKPSKFDLRRLFAFPSYGKSKTTKEVILDEQQPRYLDDDFINERLLDTDLTQYVTLPAHVDLNEWLASHTVSLVENVNLLYGCLSEYCLHTTCPAMTGPGNIKYLWLDEKNRKCKCSAPQYIDYVMSFCHLSVYNESVFPTKYGNLFPVTFLCTVQKICRFLCHVLAHVYHSHASQILALNIADCLNTTAHQFLIFTKHFSLVDKRELDCLEDLYRRLCEKITERSPEVVKNHLFEEAPNEGIESLSVLPKRSSEMAKNRLFEETTNEGIESSSILPSHQFFTKLFESPNKEEIARGSSGSNLRVGDVPSRSSSPRSEVLPNPKESEGHRDVKMAEHQGEINSMYLINTEQYNDTLEKEFLCSNQSSSHTQNSIKEKGHSDMTDRVANCRPTDFCKSDSPNSSPKSGSPNSSPKSLPARLANIFSTKGNENSIAYSTSTNRTSSSSSKVLVNQLTVNKPVPVLPSTVVMRNEVDICGNGTEHCQENTRRQTNQINGNSEKLFMNSIGTLNQNVFRSDNFVSSLNTSKGSDKISLNNDNEILFSDRPVVNQTSAGVNVLPGLINPGLDKSERLINQNDFNKISVQNISHNTSLYVKNTNDGTKNTNDTVTRTSIYGAGTQINCVNNEGPVNQIIERDAELHQAIVLCQLSEKQSVYCKTKMFGKENRENLKLDKIDTSCSGITSITLIASI